MVKKSQLIRLGTQWKPQIILSALFPHFIGVGRGHLGCIGFEVNLKDSTWDGTCVRIPMKRRQPILSTNAYWFDMGGHGSFCRFCWFQMSTDFLCFVDLFILIGKMVVLCFVKSKWLPRFEKSLSWFVYSCREKVVVCFLNSKFLLRCWIMGLLIRLFLSRKGGCCFVYSYREMVTVQLLCCFCWFITLLLCWVVAFCRLLIR